MGTVFTAPLQRIQNYVAPNFFFFFLKIKRASSSNTSLEMRTSLAFIAIISAFIGISVSLECWGRDYPEKPCQDKSLTPKVDLSACVKKNCTGNGPNSKPTCQRMRFKTKYGTKTTVSLLGCGVFCLSKTGIRMAKHSKPPDHLLTYKSFYGCSNV